MSYEVKSEKGQAMVEFALIFPLFILLIFTIIDLGWISFNYLSFDYAYREAAWELSINYDSDDTQYITGTTASKAIKNAIMDSSHGLSESNLSVSGAKFVLWTENKKYYTPKLPSGTNEHTKKWRYADIEADLKYDIEPVTPMGKSFFGEEITFSKNLEKHRLLRTREG